MCEVLFQEVGIELQTREVTGCGGEGTANNLQAGLESPWKLHGRMLGAGLPDRVCGKAYGGRYKHWFVQISDLASPPTPPLLQLT